MTSRIFSCSANKPHPICLSREDARVENAILSRVSCVRVCSCVSAVTPPPAPPSMNKLSWLLLERGGNQCGAARRVAPSRRGHRRAFFPLCTVLSSVGDNPRSNRTLGDVAPHPRRQQAYREGSQMPTCLQRPLRRGALNWRRYNDAAAEPLRSFRLGMPSNEGFPSPLREVPDVLLCGVVLQQTHQETQGLLGGVHGAAGHGSDLLRRVPVTVRNGRQNE